MAAWPARAARLDQRIQSAHGARCGAGLSPLKPKGLPHRPARATSGRTLAHGHQRRQERQSVGEHVTEGLVHEVRCGEDVGEVGALATVAREARKWQRAMLRCIGHQRSMCVETGDSCGAIPLQRRVTSAPRWPVGLSGHGRCCIRGARYSSATVRRGPWASPARPPVQRLLACPVILACAVA